MTNSENFEFNEIQLSAKYTMEL